MATNSAQSPPPASDQAKSWFQRSKVWLFLVLALVISNVGTFLYQNYQQGKLKEAHVENMKKMAGKAEALVEYRTTQNADDMGLALTYAIQAEMIRNNKGELDLFMNQMVQETEVQLVTVVDSIGMVYLSTNKKFENKHVLEVLPGIPPKVEEPILFESKMNEALYASPIMALDHRIGTLVMTYHIDQETEAMLRGIQEYALQEEK